MTSPSVTPLGLDDDAAVVAYVVAAQASPGRHVTFVGDSPVSVRADLSAPEAWRERTLVARDAAGRVTGVLTVDIDDDQGRLWWLGPWADDPATAEALLAAGDAVAPGIRRREFALDSRNRTMAALARALGYREGTPNAVLTVDLTDWVGDDEFPAAGVRELEADDRDDLVRLHDRVFPGTHTPGRRLVRDPDTTVLVVGEEPPVGYVATQLQADGALYVDYLGVEHGARRRGLGRDLVGTALHRARRGGVPRAHLTVRADNPGAISLYTSLGFAQERWIAPYLLGFARDD